MGILGIWDVLGEGEVWSIADYAAQHFEKHKRPLRIAVDEACWRFTNLTPEQVEKIREGEAAANPVEKVVLWRILRLLKLNIQLLFGNDGMKRPVKRGRGKQGMKMDYNLVKLSHQLFDALKIPYHQAPGEAEAECARMQALGIVDAVWSDDSDTLMFGCGTLIRQYKDGHSRVKDLISVYNADRILQKHGLDPERLVLFAMLAGGDYNTSGLHGCGSKTAALLAKNEPDLAHALCHASQHDLPGWRQVLQESLIRHRKAVAVPPTFPEWKVLNNYCKPNVSSPERLFDLRGLKYGWERPMYQLQLRQILRQRFNFTTREYIKHITPIFLSRALSRADPEQKIKNAEFGIQLKRTRKNAGTEDGSKKSECKITFSPLPVIEIDISQQPSDEDWGKFVAKDGTPYDPHQDIECEVLECFLRHGMPEGFLDHANEANKVARPRRKADKIESQEERGPKRPRGPERSDVVVRTSSQEATSDKTAVTAQKKKKGPSKKLDSGPRSSQVGMRHSVVGANTPNPPTAAHGVSRATFKQPRGLSQLDGHALDFCDGESDEDEVDLKSGISEAARISIFRSAPSSSSFANEPKPALVPSNLVDRFAEAPLSTTDLLKTLAEERFRRARERSTIDRPIPKSTACEIIDLT